MEPEESLLPFPWLEQQRSGDNVHLRGTFLHSTIFFQLVTPMVGDWLKDLCEFSKICVEYGELHAYKWRLFYEVWTYMSRIMFVSLLSSFGFENYVAVNSSALAELEICSDAFVGREPGWEKAACGGVTITCTEVSTLRISDLASLTLPAPGGVHANLRLWFGTERGKQQAFGLLFHRGLWLRGAHCKSGTF